MAAAVPTLDTIIEAVKTELDSVASLGTSITSRSPIEDDVSFILRNSYLSSGTMNLFVVSCSGVNEIEGPASGEVYEQFQISVYIWTVRTNDATWDRLARQKAEAARDELSGNSAVFAISGQRQLQTPETVQLVDHGPFDIKGDEGSQMVYRSQLNLAVEARRWS